MVQLTNKVTGDITFCTDEQYDQMMANQGGGSGRFTIVRIKDEPEVKLEEPSDVTKALNRRKKT